MPSNTKDTNTYVEERYNNAIKYYWKASRNNKRAYKLTRVVILVLGAVVTLIASLSSTKFISEDPTLQITFAITTPVLAALLSIAGGFSQTFQWGAAWQDMVITAEKLEKERDRFLVTPPDDRDLTKEVALLNDFVITESQGFFQRVLGGARIPETNSTTNKPNVSG